jgi:hypothetical protein
MSPARFFHGIHQSFRRLTGPLARRLVLPLEPGASGLRPAQLCDLLRTEDGAGLGRLVGWIRNSIGVGATNGWF